MNAGSEPARPEPTRNARDAFPFGLMNPRRGREPFNVARLQRRKADDIAEDAQKVVHGRIS